ncbi:hypothetical protein ACB092_11G229800 [Castanea dentata]
MDITVKDILPKGLPKIQDGELALHNKKTVAEIKDLEWNSETKDLLVTCNAKIININNKYGWYYVACLICKTKVKQVKGVLWCERCKNQPKFAVPSYRIQVQVQDETGSTTFILFDKGAEKIISKTAKELAEMQEEDTMEEIVRKSRKDKYIASPKIEIGETSVERPERMPLQMLKKHQKGTKQIASKKKKN